MLSAREKLRILQGKNSLRQLIGCCPELWRETGGEINRRLAAGRGGGAKTGAAITEAASTSLNDFVTGLNAKAEAWRQPLAASGYNLGMVERAFPDIVRARMAWLALQNYYLAALGGEGGKVRFNLWNGTILQKLLFRRGFERKPVSLFWYRLGWRLVSQKKILMRLVYKKGIYCFYSAALVRRLARLARECQPQTAGTEDGRPAPVLEIAAGDGTLSRFLRRAGLDCLATDDLSWQATAASVAKLPPDSVIALDAAAALARHRPAVVICSWPPAGNNFERQVFASPDTRLYIVIGSRHHFASGNWDSYLEWAEPISRAIPPAGASPAADRRPFSMELDEALSRLVLPRELDNAVLVFRRRS